MLVSQPVVGVGATRGALVLDVTVGRIYTDFCLELKSYLKIINVTFGGKLFKCEICVFSYVRLVSFFDFLKVIANFSLKLDFGKYFLIDR